MDGYDAEMNKNDLLCQKFIFLLVSIQAINKK